MHMVIKDYCAGCGDPIADGEDVVYVVADDEAADNGFITSQEPYHEECQPYWSTEIDRYG